MSSKGLVWSRGARAGLVRLYAFVAKSSPEAADRAIDTIRRSTTILVEHPAAGRPLTHLEPGYREWFIAFGDSGYLLRYRLEGAEVVIVSIRHAREAGY